MAYSENLIIKNLSGTMGKELVFRQYGEKTLICKYPDMSKRKLSAKQLQNNQIMEEANDEAKGILADEALRSEAQVRLNVPRTKLYTALIREYFKKVKAGEIPKQV